MKKDQFSPILDTLSYRILQQYRDDSKPIKSLINGSTKRSALYRRKNILCKNGLLKTDGKDRYRTTEQGLQQLQSLLGEAPEGLSAIYPPLTLVLTPYHVAAIELTIAAVIARQNDLRPDRHPSIVLAGQTLQWKTLAAIFLCYVLGIDPSTHVVNLTVEAGKSMWIRKASNGDISYKRDLLEAPLVVFDDFQNADSECRRLLKAWMDGRKVVPLENGKLTIQATSFVTLNPREGQTLEERIGLERAQIRRCIICDLTDIKITDLAIKGEEIVKAAKAYGPLVLPKPRHDCTPYKAKIYELLNHGLNETGRELADLETVTMLATAFTSFMEAENAVRRVLYDCLLLWETLGWTNPGWAMHVKNFPTIMTGDALISSTSSESETISDQDWIRALKHFEAGGTITELVTKMGFTIDQSEQIAKKANDLKNLDAHTHSLGSEEKDPQILKLERDVRIAELQSKKADLQRPQETDKILSNLSATHDASGQYKVRHCTHILGNYCRYWLWEQRPTLPYQVGDPLLIDGKWFIRPTPLRCSVCPAYQHHETHKKERNREARIVELEKESTILQSTVEQLANLNIILDVQGGLKRSRCSHLENDYCTNWYWTQIPNVPYRINKPLQKGGKWYIRPANVWCSSCSSYYERNTQTLVDIETRLSTLESKVNILLRKLIFEDTYKWE